MYILENIADIWGGWLDFYLTASQKRCQLMFELFTRRLFFELKIHKISSFEPSFALYKQPILI